MKLAQPQSIRAVFFDVGFTLLDIHPSIPEIVAAVAARHERRIPLARLEAALPVAETHFAELAQARPDTWSDDAAINRFWQDYYAVLLRESLPDAPDGEIVMLAREAQLAFDSGESYALFPDVIPTLDTLKTHGLTLGIVSDWGLSLGMIMRHHDLTPYFDFAVVSAATRRAKPDPALYQLALERANAIPDYAIHIGDSYVRDVLGARAAGVTGVLLDRTRTVTPAQVDCLLIYDLREVLTLLEIG